MESKVTSVSISELEQEYGDQATFVIIPAEETAESADKLAEYGFTELKHGLVVFDGEGDAIVKLPGHMFGREEIEEGLQLVLGT